MGCQRSQCITLHIFLRQSCPSLGLHFPETTHRLSRLRHTSAILHRKTRSKNLSATCGYPLLIFPVLHVKHPMSMPIFRVVAAAFAFSLTCARSPESWNALSRPPANAMQASASCSRPDHPGDQRDPCPEREKKKNVIASTAPSPCMCQPVPNGALSKMIEHVLRKRV